MMALTGAYESPKVLEVALQPFPDWYLFFYHQFSSFLRCFVAIRLILEYFV